MHRGQLVLASALFGIAASAGFVLWLANRPAGTISTSASTTSAANTSVQLPPAQGPVVGEPAASTSDGVADSAPPEEPSTAAPSTMFDDRVVDSSILRFDMAAFRTITNTIAGIPVADRTGSPQRSEQIVSFDATGNGNLLIVDRVTGNVRIFSPTGAVNEWSIAPSDLGGSIVDAAVGPDRILYVSRSPRNADGTVTNFNLVGYELSGLDPVEVKRRATDWQCVASFCGEIMFAERAVGPPYGTTMTFAGTAIAPRLPPPSRQPLDAQSPGDACVDDVGDASFGRFREEVAFRGVAWDVEVACGFNGSSGFAAYQPHMDGSVVATVSIAGRASAAPRTLLVWLRADGRRRVFDVSGVDLIGTAVVEGRLIGAQWVSSDNIDLFAFVEPE